MFCHTILDRARQLTSICVVVFEIEWCRFPQMSSCFLLTMKEDR